MQLHENIYHGPMALLVTNIERAALFWEQVIGLRRRAETPTVIEMGTKDTTLILLEDGATTSFINGYSGLYHVAIHVPTEAVFALVLGRLISLEWRISPTDHIMSKAIYLLDPDGITIEITLETPERFDRYNIHDGRFEVIDSSGEVRGATERLDVEPLLRKFENSDLSRHLPDSVKIGHIHLYVPDLSSSYDFYKLVGFDDNLLPSSIGFADLSAGGTFKHRMAMNTWQSSGAPQAPMGTAGMKYATFLYPTLEALNKAAARMSNAEHIGEKLYQTFDPGGNTLRLGLIR